MRLLEFDLQAGAGLGRRRRWACGSLGPFDEAITSIRWGAARGNASVFPARRTVPGVRCMGATVAPVATIRGRFRPIADSHPVCHALAGIPDHRDRPDCFRLTELPK